MDEEKDCKPASETRKLKGQCEEDGHCGCWDLPLTVKCCGCNKRR